MQTDRDLLAIARRFHSDWTESQGIHSNRFPGWNELSAAQRAAWVEVAKLHKANANLNAAIYRASVRAAAHLGDAK